MEASDFVAIYAAVVASAALSWQIFTWHAARRSRVTVDLKMGLAKVDDGFGPAVYVVVRNLGDQPIRIVAVGIYVRLEDESKKLIRASQGNLLDRMLPANDVGLAYLRRQDLEFQNVDFNHAMTGWADLATGERVKSPRLVLIPRPLDNEGRFLPETL